MRADGLDELKRLLGDLGVEIEPAFVSVLDIVEVTPDRELDVAALDDLAAQDRVTVAADTGCMVSGVDAAGIDSGHFRSRQHGATAQLTGLQTTGTSGCSHGQLMHSDYILKSGTIHRCRSPAATDHL